MTKLGCVILNYAGAYDAIEAHKSLAKLYTPSAFVIETFFVDNHSPDNSLSTLSAYIQTCKGCTLIALDTNVGFAQGNNAGISAARASGCEYVVCLNNDIIVPHQDSFWPTILSSVSERTAVIGPHIITLNNHFQNPMREDPLTQKEIDYYKRIYVSKVGKLRYWLTMYVLPNIVPPKPSPEHASKPAALGVARNVYMLHGSFLIFTPLFFKYFKGFDPNTFLYGEEHILAERLRLKGLHAYFQPLIRVVHKEDVSTDIFLKGRDKYKFFLKNQYNSFNHLTKHYLNSEPTN